MIGSVEIITPELAWQFLKPRHYAGRKPQMSIAFGWFIENRLVAVCTFGKPAGAFVCESVCGKENAQYVYELNRLCRVDDLKLQLSQFVSACLKKLKSSNCIIISYSDTAMHHNGYIYQACNFIYTGQTNERIDRVLSDNKHSRHHKGEYEYFTMRSTKHRYIYFCTSNKRLKRQWQESLKLDICPYPKGVNENYKLGEYHKSTLLDSSGNVVDVKKDDAYQRFSFI